jgi:hypothetical protein
MYRNCIIISLIATAACSSLPPDPSPTTGGSTGSSTGTSTSGTGSYTGPTTRLLGRAMDANGGALMSWSDSGAETRFTGTNITASLTLDVSPASVYFDVWVDGTLQSTPIQVVAGTTSYTINCGSNGTHEVRLIKRTEAGLGQVVFGGFTPDSGSLQATATPPSRRIEVIGDSITCGYGVLGFADANGNSSDCPANDSNGYLEGPLEDSDDSYATLLGQSLSADVSIVAWSGKGVYRNDDGSTTQTVPELYAYDDFSDSSNPGAQCCGDQPRHERLLGEPDGECTGIELRERLREFRPDAAWQVPERANHLGFGRPHALGLLPERLAAGDHVEPVRGQGHLAVGRLQGHQRAGCHARHDQRHRLPVSPAARRAPGHGHAVDQQHQDPDGLVTRGRWRDT